MSTSTTIQLPIPKFFEPNLVGEVWRVSYQQRAAVAKDWAQQHGIEPATKDKTRIGLLLIDVQNTFCLPDFELFVAGQSGTGAVDDNVRLCEFIYRHLGIITQIIATLDTHTAMQIFHSGFWLNEAGEHPPASTTISLEDVQQGVWKPNPAVAYSVTGGNTETLQRHALHYTKKLTEVGRYPLTIWPYHAMLGGISHALVASVQEALFFHSLVRECQTDYEQKGSHPLTENYSALQPEVLEGADGTPLAQKNTRLIEKLLAFDRLIIAGQAKSHCVAWTVEDLLTAIEASPNLAQKIYLLEDCTSPVVLGEVDFTEQADIAFERFAQAGMHIVKSTEAVTNWSGFDL